jgi:hypothetical protein
LRNRPVAQPLALESLDVPQPLPGHTPSAATPTLCPSQPAHHPALRIALLVPTHRALRFSERTRNFRLLRKTRFDQQHHRIGLGHHIIGTIVMHGQSRHDDHPLIRLHPQRTARIDGHGVRRRRRGQRQGELGVHGPQLKRTALGPQPSPQKLPYFSGLHPADPKNRTGIGPHPRRAKTSLSAG